MKKLIVIAALFCCIACDAQTVVKQGNTFIQVSKEKKEVKTVKTAYTYKTKNGKVYPIYLSSKGKAYIIRKSKNGKDYRQYLPEVTKALQNNKK